MLGVGAEIAVRGEVSEYEGDLEVIPEQAEDVQIVAAASLPPEATIDVLTPADVGRVMILRGTLSERETFSQGVRFRLDDGTGSIILLLWQNVYDEIVDAEQLVVGARVEVTGEIEEYRGDLEIVPEAAGVRIIGED
jgi:DNA/RNA endonuclease YhcR with UshA esterase domain